MRALAQRILPPILRVLEVFSAILIFTMMVLTFADVIGRYVFTAPIFGAAEMIQFLLAMTIFGGLCLINAADEHITVELFEPFLDRWIPRARIVIIQAFSVFVMAIIAIQMIRFALEAHRIGKLTFVLEWPLVVVAGTVAFLSLASLIIQILGLMLPRRSHQLPDQGGSL